MRLPLALLLAATLGAACTLRGTDDLQRGLTGGGGAGASGGSPSGGNDPQGGGGACPSGEVDCGEGCVDIFTDPDHCGRCDYGCGQGTCAGGTCELSTLMGVMRPEDGVGLAGADAWYAGGSAFGGLYKVPHDGSAPTEYQTGADPYALAIDETNLYWLDETFSVVMRKQTAMPPAFPPCFDEMTFMADACPATTPGPLINGLVLGQAFALWTVGSEIRSVSKGSFMGPAPFQAGEDAPGHLDLAPNNQLFWTTTNAIRATGPVDAHPRIKAPPRRLDVAPDGTSVCWSEFNILPDDANVVACADLSSGTLRPAESIDTDTAISIANAGDVVHWATAPRIAQAPMTGPGRLLRLVRPFGDNEVEVLFEAPDRDVAFVTLIGQELFFATYLPMGSVPGPTTFYRRHVEAPAPP